MSRGFATCRLDLGQGRRSPGPLRRPFRRTQTYSTYSFIARVAYEGHSILDFVAENRSALQPDAVHAGTHGQSAATFGLAHLLGTELMPRIHGPEGSTVRSG